MNTGVYCCGGFADELGDIAGAGLVAGLGGVSPGSDFADGKSWRNCCFGAGGCGLCAGDRGVGSGGGGFRAAECMIL